MNAELIVEFLSIAAYLLAATVLTIGGLFVEYASLQYLGSGNLEVAVWLALFGALLLYAGLYGFGYGKVLSRLG